MEAPILNTPSVEISISDAFNELSNYRITWHGFTNKKQKSEWLVIQKSSSINDILYLRKLQSTESSIKRFIQSAHLYSTYLGNIQMYNRELKLVQPILKYALSKEKNNVEILSQYSGIPIACLWSTLSNNQPIDDPTKINIMSIIYSQCMKKLSNFVCGTLSSETILYNHINNKVRIQDAYALKHNDQVSASHPFYIERPGIYYSQTYKNLTPKVLNKSDAITADIKALAICIWELGLNESFSIKEFIADKEIVISELIKLDQIFENTKNQYQSAKLKKVLLTILNAKKELIYNLEELKVDLPNMEQNADFKTIKATNESANIFTLNGKPFMLPGMKLRKYKTKNVYLISFENNSAQDNFIVKKFQNMENRKRERQIYQMIEDSNKITPIQALTKIKKTIETGPYELAIEYAGLTLPQRFQNYGESDHLLPKLLIAIIDIATDLNRLKLFHGSINPNEISMNEIGECKLFDFELSYLNLVPVDASKNKFDEDIYSLQIRGVSVDYCSPEILRSLLENKETVQINPFKSDIYSFAKTALAVITNWHSPMDFISNLYGVKFKSENNYMEELKSLVNTHLLYQLECKKCLQTSKPKALFYYLNNDTLVKQVKMLKPMNIKCDEILLHTIMNMLSAMLATNPNERPNLEQLKAMYQQTARLGNFDTFKYFGPSQISSITDDYEIISFIPETEPSTDKKVRYITTAIFDKSSTTQQKIVKLSKINFKKEDNISQAQYKYEIIGSLELSNNISIYASMSQVHCIIESTAQPICYLIGGYHNLVPVKTVLALENNHLIKKSDMANARAEFGAISWNGFIAVAGGISEKEYTKETKVSSIYLNTLEIYNAKLNKWNNLIMLKEHKKSVAMAYKDDKIYVIGGIVDAHSSTFVYSKENFNYGNLIEVVNASLNSLDKSVCIIIKNDLINGICTCPVLFEDKQTILILAENLIERESPDSVETVYKMHIDMVNKEATIVQDSDGLEYYGYKAWNCFETMSGYVFLPQINEFVDPKKGKVIEYNKAEKKLHIFSLTQI